MDKHAQLESVVTIHPIGTRFAVLVQLMACFNKVFRRAAAGASDFRCRWAKRFVAFDREKFSMLPPNESIVRLVRFLYRRRGGRFLRDAGSFIFDDRGV